MRNLLSRTESLKACIAVLNSQENYHKSTCDRVLIKLKSESLGFESLLLGYAKISSKTSRGSSAV